MTPQKQKKVIEILGSGKYDVNIYSGEVLKYYTGIATWKPMKCNDVHGYKQYELYPGRGKGERITAYGHQIVWLFAYGEFDPGMTIRHKNGIKGNNRANNLELIPNIYGKKRVAVRVKDDNARIKGNDILRLVELYDACSNYKEVERMTGISRITIMYLVKRYKSGLKMRFL
jgi:hypothetical protein